MPLSLGDSFTTHQAPSATVKVNPIMRCTFILLLVATALLAEISGIHYTNEDQGYEERAVGAGELLKQATNAKMLKAADSVRVRFWLRKGKPADAIFKRLKLDKGVDEVLNNKNLATWFTYVKLYNQKRPDKTITISEMLTKTYGDEAVAKMLEIARDVPSTSGVANKLLRQMGDTWWRDKKLPDDVFGLLNLDKVGDNIFSRREFNTWATYTRSAERDPQVSMINILTERLGADKLARSFVTAKSQDPELKVLAVKLQSTMLLEWDRKRLSVDDVFALLKLDDGVEKVFANPALETWMGYVNLFSENSQAQLTTMVKTLIASYDSGAVARMLEAARKMEDTTKLATNMQNAQFKLWRRELKRPAHISKTFDANNEVDAAIIRAHITFYK